MHAVVSKQRVFTLLQLTGLVLLLS